MLSSLLPLKNVLCMSAFIIALIQLFSSFGTLNGIELPLEFLHEGVKGAKSRDFARRMPFPLAASDNGVELPPNVEDNMELNAPNDFRLTGIEDSDDLEENLPVKSEMPKWLQMSVSEPHQHNNFHQSSSMSQKHKPTSKHQHTSISSLPAVSPLRRCSIEISSKIPGICQAMGSIGNACVSGDYIDVFNSECL